MIPPMFKIQWHTHDPSRIFATNGLLMIAKQLMSSCRTSK
jgi:hypothetical protein